MSYIRAGSALIVTKSTARRELLTAKASTGNNWLFVTIR
jgi:hypothetical protein